MNEDTIFTLRSINQKFYQTFADPFSQTRQRLQPGVQQMIKRIPMDAAILDLGCGNGSIFRQLVQQGFRGFYFGIDISHELLKIAQDNLSEADLSRTIFLQLDLADLNWDKKITSALRTMIPPHSKMKFNFILAFAIMHHIPGIEIRRNVLRNVHHLLVSDGLFIQSNWQFLNSPRLQQRILDWTTIGLTDQDVDPNDYLLDWRLGGIGVRYVHHFDELELTLLAEETGFSIIDTFRSDGEGGKLALYQVWKTTNNTSLPAPSN